MEYHREKNHDIMNKARSLWSALLLDLPKIPAHKAKLREHWKKNHPDLQMIRVICNQTKISQTSSSRHFPSVSLRLHDLYLE